MCINLSSLSAFSFEITFINLTDVYDKHPVILNLCEQQHEDYVHYVVIYSAIVLDVIFMLLVKTCRTREMVFILPLDEIIGMCKHVCAELPDAFAQFPKFKGSFLW